MKIKKAILLVLLILAAQMAYAQALVPVDNPWYVGAGAGTSFGQCTFRSITEGQMHWGIQGGVSGGYRFNRLLSLEAGLQFGRQKQTSLDCCTYWLSEDNVRYISPVLGETGWYYHELENSTGWGKFAIQANADLLSLVTAPDCRWSLNAGPQISAVTTKTKLIAPDREIAYDRQWHLGIGGQASVGYRITERIGASLYGGITCLTGDRFDNLPRHAHRSNLIWDVGVKLAFSFGGRNSGGTDIIVEPTPADDDEASRLAAELAERERLAAEEAERLERERAEAERLAREEAERLEREARENAFNTPIPTVYFANNSAVIEHEYQKSLEEVLKILKKYPDFKLELHAYSSWPGSRKYNEELSRIRMDAVREWFMDRGISEDRLDNSYFHGIDYSAPDADHARRVDLKFVK